MKLHILFLSALIEVRLVAVGMCAVPVFALLSTALPSVCGPLRRLPADPAPCGPGTCRRRTHGRARQKVCAQTCGCPCHACAPTRVGGEPVNAHCGNAVAGAADKSPPRRKHCRKHATRLHGKPLRTCLPLPALPSLCTFHRGRGAVGFRALCAATESVSVTSACVVRVGAGSHLRGVEGEKETLTRSCWWQPDFHDGRRNKDR